MLRFDESYYLAINEARWQAAECILDAAAPQEIRTCLDIACGPGWFAQKLVERGLDVAGLEARAELIEAARARVPQARFTQIDLNAVADAPTIASADLAFCFGCLYHLENPLAFLRHLYQWTGKLALVETQVITDTYALFQMVDEGQNETQGLSFSALVPSDAAVVKGLAWAGFPHIYEWQEPIGHDDFIETETHHRRRRIYVASLCPLEIVGLAQRKVEKARKPSHAK